MEINQVQEYINTQKAVIQELMENNISIRTSLNIVKKQLDEKNERVGQLTNLLQEVTDRKDLVERRLEDANKTISEQSNNLRDFHSIQSKAGEVDAYINEVKRLKNVITEKDSIISELENSKKKAPQQQQRKTASKKEVVAPPIVSSKQQQGDDF